MRIGDWIDERAGEMAELLMRLVVVDTENPPGRGLFECAEVLAEAMTALDLAPEVHRGRRRGWPQRRDRHRSVRRGRSVIYFHGHFDVVPVQSRSQFEPRRADGRITGRGTADMKGGIVSMLYGAAAARDLGLLAGTRIELHLVCDEETGSTMGSGHLRAHDMIDPRAVAMLTAEPTDGVVWHANRGAITAKVTVAGQEAHVGLRHQGDNAFQRLMAVAEPLSEFADQLLDEHTDLAVEAPGSMMVVGGAIGAGANFNVVPGAAWFSIDWRFNPERTLDAELARLHEQIGSAPPDRCSGHRRDPPAAAGRRDTDRPPAGTPARRVRRSGRGRHPALRAVPRRARHALVRPARRPGLRVRRRAAGHLPRP